MPSGSKKRKAAKKKKESELSDPSAAASVRSNEGDDVKHQDEKKIDDVEVSSPASPDPHSYQNPLTEGEEEENNEGVEDVSGVQVEREFKIEDESHKKNGEMEYLEQATKAYDGSSSGSSRSSSSSDDDSPDIKISQAVVDVSQVVDLVKGAEAVHSDENDESGETVVENSLAIDSEKNEALEIHAPTPLDNYMACDAVESLSKENREEKPRAIEGHVGISSHVVTEEGTLQSCEDTAQGLDPKCVEPKPDGGSNLSYCASGTGAEYEENSGVTQPLLAPAPRAVQATSWKSCCGLFELFSGSDR